MASISREILGCSESLGEYGALREENWNMRSPLGWLPADSCSSADRWCLVEALWGSVANGGIGV